MKKLSAALQAWWDVLMGPFYPNITTISVYIRTVSEIDLLNLAERQACEINPMIDLGKMHFYLSPYFRSFLVSEPPVMH